MKPRIVFMGTPDFAVPSLQILLEHQYQVVGVITATDKMGGRGGKKLLESPVKRFAMEKGLRILQPPNLKNPAFQEELRSLKADLQIVVAFRMLPEAVWQMPRLGTFNLHGSLLPKYRGAAPINWAVINGDAETGVTTFFIQKEIDTGDLILQKRMDIGENDTAGDVHDRMMILGADAVLETVQMIEAGPINLLKQNDALATKAPKIFRETCEIDFAQSTVEVHNFVRGLSPFPAAWTRLNDQVCKILETRKERVDHDYPVGTWLSDNRKWIKIATKDGFVQVLQLQLQGRKRMETSAFLNGYELNNQTAIIIQTES